MKLYKFIWHSIAPFKLYLLGMLFCTFIIAIDSNLRPYIVKLIINQKDFNLTHYLFLGGAFVFSEIAMLTSDAASDWLFTKFHTKYRVNLIHKYFDKLSKYPYSFFQENHISSISNRLSDAFNLIPNIILICISKFINFFLVISITISILYSVNHFFMLATIVWVMISLCLSTYFYKKYNMINVEIEKCRPKVFGFLTDYLNNIMSVWSFSNQKFEKDNFFLITKDWEAQNRRAGVFFRKFYFVHGLAGAGYMTAVFAIMGTLRIEGEITPGDFSLVFIFNAKITRMLYDISGIFREFVTSCDLVKKANNFLEQQIELEDLPGAKKLIVSEGCITLEQVSFSYKNTRKLFDKLSLKIQSGQKVGLIGHSGSGMSSFVNLLLRLYDVSDGKILIDNQNIQEVTLDSLRESLAIIPQNPILFNRSLLENIRYGKITATDEEVIEAAKLAKAHNFIEQLSDGYNTIIDERGIILSSGERQLIAIARAMLKKAPIVILDEATSELDSLTEEEVLGALVPLINKSTTIDVSQRLSTLVHMDRILVFDQGKIVQDGTHKELLSQDGLYKSMWDSQVVGVISNRTF